MLAIIFTYDKLVFDSSINTSVCFYSDCQSKQFRVQYSLSYHFYINSRQLIDWHELLSSPSPFDSTQILTVPECECLIILSKWKRILFRLVKWKNTCFTEWTYFNLHAILGQLIFVLYHLYIHSMILRAFSLRLSIIHSSLSSNIM